MLETSWNGIDGALELLASRHGGAVLVRSAVELDNSSLIEIAARQVVRRRSLLAGLDPTKRGWRRLWLSTVQSGAEPWAGIPEPRVVRDRLLDRALDAGDVDPVLLGHLGGSELAALLDYPRRRELWPILSGSVRERFLAETARAWIARFRMDPEEEPIPEAEVCLVARHNSSLFSIEAANPVGGLRVGVSAFERLQGWDEGNLLNWLRMVEKVLNCMQPREAVRLGRIIETNRWREAAQWLLHHGSTIPAVHAVIQECWSLLGPFDRFFAKIKFSGTSARSSHDWYEALAEIALRHYPRGPEDDKIWARAGGEEGRIRGASGYERWHSAIDLLRSGRGGSKISPKKLVREMLGDSPHNDDLRILHDQAP
jgi:hypothetical protein